MRKGRSKVNTVQCMDMQSRSGARSSNFELWEWPEEQVLFKCKMTNIISHSWTNFAPFVDFQKHSRKYIYY